MDRWKWRNLEKKKKFLADVLIASVIVLIGIIVSIFIN
jgi:hypothetical protein